MDKNNLHELITEKGFNKFQGGLSAQFEAEGIDYIYTYTNNANGNGITVWLNFGNIPATLTISEDGAMGFTYFNGGKQSSEKFIYCIADDFHTLIAHSFIYLRDGTFDHHRQWYDALNRAHNN